MERINIMATRHSAFYSPLLVTIAGGFLQKEGLEPHYSVATPEQTVPGTLRSGETHVGQFAVGASFADLEQGKAIDLVHFAQINRMDGFFLAGRKQEPDFKWQNLIGKTVLVDHLFQPLATFRYVLHQQGIDESAVKIVDAGSVEEMDKAFRNGEGDYVQQQGPFPQQLAHDGVGYPVAAMGEAVGPLAFSSLCTTREWTETDMASAFMRAYRQGSQFALESTAEEIAQLEASFFPEIEKEVLIQTIATYQGMGTWSKDPVIDRQAYEHLLEVFLYAGLISKAHAYESCITTPPESSAS
jgi:NitT/TauT family transport system substrate-binding protein